MKLNSTILLYSVNSYLAFYINEMFYGQHFVWCSPVYDTAKLDASSLYKKIPASSNPSTICNRFKQDVNDNDLHSTYITNNKTGLKNGAIKMLEKNKIDEFDFARIDNIINNAQITQFAPVLYLILKPSPKLG